MTEHDYLRTIAIAERRWETNAITAAAHAAIVAAARRALDDAHTSNKEPVNV